MTDFGFLNLSVSPRKCGKIRSTAYLRHRFANGRLLVLLGLLCAGCDSHEERKYSDAINYATERRRFDRIVAAETNPVSFEAAALAFLKAMSTNTSYATAREKTWESVEVYWQVADSFQETDRTKAAEYRAKSIGLFRTLRAENGVSDLEISNILADKITSRRR